MVRITLEKTLILASSLFLAVAVLGCSTPRKVWTVTQYAHPNPLAGETHFAVVPLDFTDLRVGEELEDDYIARKGEDFKRLWVEDKHAMSALFTEQLTSLAAYRGIRISATPADAPFVIRPSVTFIGRGYFGGPFKKRAVLRAVVDITGPDGELIDQIVVREVVGIPEAGHLNITAGERMRRLAEKLGAHTASYVYGRAFGS